MGAAGFSRPVRGGGLGAFCLFRQQGFEPRFQLLVVFLFAVLEALVGLLQVRADIGLVAFLHIQGDAEILQGVPEVSFQAVQFAAIAEGRGEVVLRAYGAAVGVNGLVILLEQVVGQALIEVGPAVGTVLLEGEIRFPQGFRPVAFADVLFGFQHMGLGRVAALGTADFFVEAVRIGLVIRFAGRKIRQVLGLGRQGDGKAAKQGRGKGKGLDFHDAFSFCS